MTKTNPYRGLEKFTEDDQEFFFGRTDATNTLLTEVQAIIDQTNRVEKPALLTVTGASGSGKSSLVRAGLIPKLHEQDDKWLTISVVPGETPFVSLASAILPLLEPNKLSSETDKLQEIRKMAQALRAGELALSDYLPRLLEIQAAKHLFLLIDQFEQLLTAHHTLLELFRRKTPEHVMTFDAYKEIGGVEGALTQRAEKIYSDLSEAQKELARKIFIELVDIDETEGHYTSRRVSRANLNDLGNSTEVETALQQLSDEYARLVISGDQV